MWKLGKPTKEAGETFLTCISRVSSPELKARLQQIEATIISVSNDFETAATNTLLHTLPVTDNVDGLVTVKEMSKVYKQRMAKKGAPGRPIYDELLAAPVYKRCPLCGHRRVTTLDHHLPKAHYPALAVTPINLVPSCADCNKAKLENAPQCSEEETLHPYFDNIENDRWLYAEVIETQPAVLRFFVTPPGHWDQTMSIRVQRHFNMLGLSELYASHAAEELVNIQYSLNIILAEDGPNGIRSHLGSEAVSRTHARINSWETAMYEAIATNDWFCNGGFALD